jgi:hypothetical protein
MMVYVIRVIMSCRMVLSYVVGNCTVKFVTYITHWIVSRTKDFVTLMMMHYIMVFVTQVFGCLMQLVLNRMLYHKVKLVTHISH